MGNSVYVDTRRTSGPTFTQHLDAVFQVLLLLLIVFIPLIVWDLTGIPKPAAKQAFGELLTAFVAILWLLKMNETGRWRVRVSALTGAALLVLIVEVLSVVVAVNRGCALRSVRQTAFPILLYLVTVNNVKGERMIRGCLIAVAASAFIVSAYGIIQSKGADFMGWCEIRETCVLAPSSFESAAAAANFLVIAFPITVALIFYSRASAGKVGAAAAAVLILLHLRLTARAEAVVVLELALAAAFVVVWTVRRERVRAGTVDVPHLAAGRLLASILCILVVLGATHVLAVMRSGSADLRDVRPTLQERRLLRKAAWGCAARMAMDHPVLGTGIGSYEIESPPYWNDFQKRWFAQSPETEVPVENEYLTAAAESGVAGLAASVLVVSLSCVYFLAACRRTSGGRQFYLAIGVGSAVVAAALNAFCSSGFREPTVLFLYFFLLAMVEVIAGEDESEQGQAAGCAYRKRPAVYYTVWAVLIPVTLLIPLFVARPLAYHQHMKAGRDSSLLERFEDARREFDSAYRMLPGAWEPAVEAARNRAFNSRIGLALRYANAVVCHPNHLVALVNGGEAFLGFDDKEVAIDWLEKAVRLTPYIPSAWYSLGEAYVAVENWSAALESFDAAEQSGFSDLTGLRVNQYVCLYRLGRHSRSDERLEELLRLEPEDPKVWYEVGRVELQRNRTSAALAAFNKALSLSERDRPERSVLAGTHSQLALLHLEERNDIVAASRHAVRALEIDPADRGVAELVKRLVELAGSDEVRAENAQVLPEFLYNVGVSLALSLVDEDPEPFLLEAAALAEEALPALVRNAHVRLAELKLKLHSYDEARAHLDVAERADPFDYNIFRLRGDVYAAVGVHEKAREAYLRALHIRPADPRSRAALIAIEGFE